MVRAGVAKAVNQAAPVVIQPVPVEMPPPDNPPVNPPKDQAAPPANLLEKKEYVYSQRNGRLTLGNDTIGTGYSGRGEARNNPAMQNQPKVGPISTGVYVIMGRDFDPNTREPSIEIWPVPPGNSAGRFPAEMFRIRCETNPPDGGAAGDIVLPRAAIDRIETRGRLKIMVVP
jgi:hypothetical protein